MHAHPPIVVEEPPLSDRPPVSAQDPNELLQVVDSKDRPLRAATREEIHRQGWRHRAVHVLVFNRAGDLYLQRRSAGKDRYPGYWDSSASGHVLAGESYDQAALRELREEIGVEAEKLEPVGAVSASPDSDNEFIRVYALTHDGPFRPNEAEIDEARFFSISQVRLELSAKTRRFAPAFGLAFRAWMSSGETISDAR